MANNKTIAAIESQGLVSQIILLLVFSIGVLRNIHLPGLFFDAVNPDYLAAKILAGNTYISHFPPWDNFPILGNYYHGQMHTYFGLVFFKIFGFSVFSLRIAQAIFGFGILLISNSILSKITGSRVLSLAIISLLALDPAFIFAFRTQNYITLSPLLFLLISLYLLLLIRDKHGTSDHGGMHRVMLVISGVLTGWAFYGYFIYIFFLPAFIAINIFIARKSGQPAFKMVLYWLAGFALGAVLYFLGYARLWQELGGFSEILRGVDGLNMAGNPFEFFQRPYYLLIYTVWSLSGDFHYSAIFKSTLPTAHGVVKFILMVSINLIAFVALAVRKRLQTSLGFILLLIMSFFVVSLFFAGRIGPHHMIPMLPFLYITLGASLHQAGSYYLKGGTELSWRIASASLISLVLFLAFLNLQQQNIFQKQLVETGGVEYYSDSQTLLAEEAKHDPDPPYYVFGEWGFIGSFALLTAGKIPYNPVLDEWAVGQVPCSTDLAILFWGLTNPLIESFADTQGHVINRKIYYQRDGAVSFTALRVSDRTNCSLSDTYPDY